MPYLNLGQSNLYYELEGTGVPVVFIHGAMGTNIHWKEQLRFFAEKYQVCAVDLPGHGRSERVPQEISIGTYAKIVADLITLLQMEQPVVCGHSMGGAIGLQLTLDHPSLLGGLVLVGTGAKLGVHPDILMTIRTNFRETIDLYFDQWAFSKQTAPELVETVKQQVLETKPLVAVADWEACNVFDCRTRLGELQLPTLMIVGEEDKLTPVWYSEYLLKHIKASSLEKIPDAGHYVMLEQVEWFNKVLLAFLERIL